MYVYICDIVVSGLVLTKGHLTYYSLKFLKQSTYIYKRYQYFDDQYLYMKKLDVLPYSLSSCLCKLLHSCGDVLLLLSVWYGTCSTEIPLVEEIHNRNAVGKLIVTYMYCTCVYMYVHIIICMQYICICMCLCTYVRMYICMYVCM